MLQNDQAHQVLVHLLLTIPDPMQNTRVQMVEELTKTNKKRKSDIVNYYKSHYYAFKLNHNRMPQ